MTPIDTTCYPLTEINCKYILFKKKPYIYGITNFQWQWSDKHCRHISAQYYSHSIRCSVFYVVTQSPSLFKHKISCHLYVFINIAQGRLSGFMTPLPHLYKSQNLFFRANYLAWRVIHIPTTESLAGCLNLAPRFWAKYGF